MTISTPQKLHPFFAKTCFKWFLSLVILPGFNIAKAQQQLNCTSTISSNFNGTAIPAGKYVWFNAHFKVAGIVNNTVLTIDQQTITSPNFTLTVPSSKVTFSSSFSSPGYTFSSGFWNINIPLSGSDEVFFAGLAYVSPGLPGGINPVDWKATFTASTPGVSLDWQWSAAVYNNFSMDYNALNVLLVHASEHAGTPMAYAYAGNVNGGARGGAGSNFTGSWSATQNVAPCSPSGGPLGTVMANFQGNYSSNVANLAWFTFNETGISSFDVERSSDGVNFSRIATINSKGISTGSQYQFTDKMVASGINYYRLKINASSSMFEYSNVVAINAVIKGITVSSVYPNPFRDQVKVSILSENNEPVSIRIIDNSGRVVKVNNTITQKGSNEIIMNDLANLQRGIYVVEVKTRFTMVRSKVSK